MHGLGTIVNVIAINRRDYWNRLKKGIPENLKLLLCRLSVSQ